MSKFHRMTATLPIVLRILCCLTLVACAPTIEMKAPQEPITINLNVKLDADVRVKLEEEAKKDIETNPNIF